MSRWIRNLGVYVAVIAGATLALGLVAFVSDGGFAKPGEAGEAFATWLIFTLIAIVSGMLVLLPYLVVVELALRRGQRRRLAAVVLAALFAGGGLALSQVGHITMSLDSLVVALSAAGLGALYGALVRLPLEVME